MFCTLAALIDTGAKRGRKVLQQSSRPHEPMPPTILASSRTPTWRSSTRRRRRLPRSRARSRSSTRASDAKYSVARPFSPTSAWNIFTASFSCAAASRAAIKASAARSLSARERV